MQSSGLCGYNRWLEGEEAGFCETVNAYNKRLIYYVNQKIGSLSYAEDAAAEAFVKLLIKKPKFKDEAQLCAWLYKSAHNCAVDFARKYSRSLYSLDDKNEAFEELSLDYELIQDDEKRLIHSSLCELKNEYKQILVLLYFEEMSYKEIAKIMKKSEKQIKNLAYRARAALRTLLEGKGFTYENR